MADDLELEIAQLHAAVDVFAAAMKAKLEQKARQGFRGWDDLENIIQIGDLLRGHVQRGPGQAIDIANLAMMLHWHYDLDFQNEALRGCAYLLNEQADPAEIERLVQQGMEVARPLIEQPPSK